MAQADQELQDYKGSQVPQGDQVRKVNQLMEEKALKEQRLVKYIVANVKFLILICMLYTMQIKRQSFYSEILLVSLEDEIL